MLPGTNSNRYWFYVINQAVIPSISSIQCLHVVMTPQMSKTCAENFVLTNLFSCSCWTWLRSKIGQAGLVANIWNRHNSPLIISAINSHRFSSRPCFRMDFTHWTSIEISFHSWDLKLKQTFRRWSWLLSVGWGCWSCFCFEEYIANFVPFSFGGKMCQR